MRISVRNPPDWRFLYTLSCLGSHSGLLQYDHDFLLWSYSKKLEKSASLVRSFLVWYLLTFTSLYYLSLVLSLLTLLRSSTLLRLSPHSLKTSSFSNFLTPKNPPLAKKRGLGKGGVREEITETIRLWTSSVDHHDTSDRSGESYESQSVDVAIKDTDSSDA